MLTFDSYSECIGLWQIPFDADSPVADSNIFAQSSKCPNWNDDCVQIKIDITGNTLCSGVFVANESFGEDNVYQKSGGDVVQYWYFNYHSFAWICSDAIDFGTCIATGHEVSYNSDYWKDIDVDGSTTVSLQSGNTAVITCLERATTTTDPAVAPTNAPTQDSHGYMQHISVFTVFVVIFSLN